jgi:hypothetical protein
LRAEEALEEPIANPSRSFCGRLAGIEDRTSDVDELLENVRVPRADAVALLFAEHHLNRLVAKPQLLFTVRSERIQDPLDVRDRGRVCEVGRVVPVQEIDRNIEGRSHSLYET